jgi:riboflavin synthase alpha subunit
MTNIKKYVLLSAIMVFAGSLAMVVPAFAQGNGMGMFGRGPGAPGVFGSVTAISGSTLTVTAKTRPNSTATATVYTIDASNAKITKNNVSAAISDIAVGDTVMVQGTVSGTNVMATAIRDGVGRGIMQEQKSPIIQGNGQPIIAGSITAINGTSLTVTNASNIIYTVDATNAKIVKMNTASTLSSVAVGDNVVVQGAVNGTSVVAYSVIDSSVPANNTAKPHMGFFGAIGNFFSRLFGF